MKNCAEAGGTNFFTDVQYGQDDGERTYRLNLKMSKSPLHGALCMSDL